MATLVNNKANKSASTQVSNRSFDEVCTEVYSVEEFCKMQGIKQIDVRINPKKVNEKTGEPNLFLVFGKETGSVSEKVQRAYYERGEMPDRPMIGKMLMDSGEEVFTLFNQGGAESAFSLGLEED